MRKSGLTGDEAYVLSKHGKATEDLDPLKKELGQLKEDLDELSFNKKSSNLFNEKAIIDNVCFNADGNLIEEANFLTTNNISVNSGETIFFSREPNVGYTDRFQVTVFRLFFFDFNSEIIRQPYESVKSVTVPAGAASFRASISKINVTGRKFAINIGGIEEYEEYYNYKVLKSQEQIDKNAGNIADINKLLDKNFITSFSSNLFNENDVEVGLLLASGEVDGINYPRYLTTGFNIADSKKTIYFSRQDEGQTYRTPVKCYVCFYDINKIKVLNRVDDVVSCVIPNEAYYFRVSVSISSVTDKDFAINYGKIEKYEQYHEPTKKSIDHDLVNENKKFIDYYSKNARNIDFSMISKSCNHTLRKPLVTIIADDGWSGDYIKLKDMVDKVHETYPDISIPCCIALQTNVFHLPNGMTQEQMLYSQNELGWEYCCHVDGTNLANLETEKEIENKIVESLKLYAEYGANVKNIVYCEGGNDERVRRIAKKYFNCGATTLPWYGGNDNTSDNNGIIGSFYLKRHGLGEYPSGDGTFENDYKIAVDNAIKNTGWLIFMLHPNSAAHDEQQQSYFIDTVKYCIEKSVDIVTLQQGYEIFGNALECGDFLGSATTKKEQGFAISKNGELSKSLFSS